MYLFGAGWEGRRAAAVALSPVVWCSLALDLDSSFFPFFSLFSFSGVLFRRHAPSCIRKVCYPYRVRLAGIG